MVLLSRQCCRGPNSDYIHVGPRTLLSWVHFNPGPATPEITYPKGLDKKNTVSNV